MDIFEFEQAIIDGQITDYRPYVENGTFCENRERKALCIRYGVAQELYPEWAQSNDPDDWIQLLLAETVIALTSYPNQKLKIFSQRFSNTTSITHLTKAMS